MFCELTSWCVSHVAFGEDLLIMLQMWETQGPFYLHMLYTLTAQSLHLHWLTLRSRNHTIGVLSNLYFRSWQLSGVRNNISGLRRQKFASREVRSVCHRSLTCSLNIPWTTDSHVKVGLLTSPEVSLLLHQDTTTVFFNLFMMVVLLISSEKRKKELKLLWANTYSL